MQSAIIIPSYNSNNSLLELINILNNAQIHRIIVIDDGSEVPFHCKNDNVTVLRNDSNMGKGYSLQKGFKHADEIGFSYVVSMDADLQHNPLEIQSFLSVDSSYDFVLGYREKTRSMPIARKLSNLITSFLISLLTGVKIFDSQCGYRRYKLDKVLLQDYRENGFQFESEILIKAIDKNISIKQIKIETIYDKNNKSYIRHVSDTMKFIRLIIRSILGM